MFARQLFNVTIRTPCNFNYYKRLFRSTNDPYAVLGVSGAATPKEIKSAYNKLIKETHPDLHPGKSEQFKQIQEAYSKIKDLQANPHKQSAQSSNQSYRTENQRTKQANYDSSRYQTWSSSSYTEGDTGYRKSDWFTSSHKSNVTENIEDMVRDLFGDSYVGKGKQKTANKSHVEKQKHNVCISFLESCLGTSTIVAIKKCTVCNGTGINGYTAILCQHCGGKGVIQIERGAFSVVIPCPTCLKQCKTKIPIYCTYCDSRGNNHSPKNYEVSIPAGVIDKQILEFSVDNSLHQLEVNVLESSVFTRFGDDIHTTVTIDYLEAIMGANIKTVGIRGELEFNLPAGTSSHTTFRLRGFGIKNGDHIVTVKIGAPKAYNAKTSEILSDLAKMRGFTQSGSSVGQTQRKYNDLISRITIMFEESSFLRRFIKWYKVFFSFFSRFVK